MTPEQQKPASVVEPLRACPNPWCASHLRNGGTAKPTLIDTDTSKYGAPTRIMCSYCCVATPYLPSQAEAVAAWNANPDGPEAAALIERLSAEREGLAETLADGLAGFRAIDHELTAMGHSCGNSMRALTEARRRIESLAALTQGESRQTGERERMIAAMSIELEKHPAFFGASTSSMVWASRMYDAAPPLKGCR